MSPTASLVGRENVTNCSHQLLTTVVERLLGAPKTERELYSISISRKNQLTLSKITSSALTSNRFVSNTTNSSTSSENNKTTLLTDEGFESDIDNASLLSSDGDSSIHFPVSEKSCQTQISDSANSSSASDSSDSEINVQQSPKFEHYHLDSVVCYTNIRYPQIIGFVVQKDAALNDFLVFEFSTSQSYDRIRYAYNALRGATSSAVVVHKNNASTPPASHKFNLVHRTDKNGVTHIEISRDNALTFHHKTAKNATTSNQQPSSIISINTPEVDTQADRNLLFDFKLTNLSKMRSNSHADLLNDVKQQQHRSNSHANLLDDAEFSRKVWSSSQNDLLASKKNDTIDGIIRVDIDSENIDTKKFKTLNVNLHKRDEPVLLKKVWRSAEDILDSEIVPKKPERRRKPKGKAPPPPNVMKGQYIRVNVDPNRTTNESGPQSLQLTHSGPSPGPATNPNHSKMTSFEMSKLDNYNSNWVYVQSQPSSLVLTSMPLTPHTPAYDTFKKNASSSEFRTEFVDQRAFTLNRNRTRELLQQPKDLMLDLQKWTNSVSRMPKMPRSRSESRYKSKNNPYKFVDTTLSLPPPPQQHSYACMNNTYHNSTTPRFNNNFSTHSLPTVTNNLSSPTSISNRLFGLSQKLKEFSTNVVNNNNNNSNNSNNSINNQRFLSAGDVDTRKRRNSLGELGFKTSNVANLSLRYGGSGDVASNLKSVIKKNDDRKIKNNNEKKVTFSAFATVQVV